MQAVFAAPRPQRGRHEVYADARRRYADQMTLETEELIELYASPDAVEAERIVLLLGQDGIEGLVRATTSTSFPIAGATLILVAAHDVGRARGTIENARREGAISDGGEFTTP